MQDDPLMNLNDGGFDLFGGDLAGLDFAAMVDAEHAEAREANNKRRKRDRGELEGEEEVCFLCRGLREGDC